MKNRVLIVEPDESLLESYRTCLSRRGFKVATATNGPDGVRSLSNFAPHVLVLEPDLADGWGDKMLTMMRDDPRVPCVPVVILTRWDRRASKYPVREYFVKPCPMTRLVSAIRRAAEEPALEFIQH
jgi:DNA-binding response OmpR family regulator